MTFACVFPGQGSQSVGMMSDWAASNETVRQTFAEASEALGYDLWHIISEGPAEELNRTEITQPAMLAAGIAAWRAYQKAGGAMPVAMAGHSLGEYTALVAAKSLEFGAALKLVAERGRLMQAAVPASEGAMAAILGLDDEQVIAVCQQAAASEVCEAVNFNSPGQVVIAGNKAAVERAIALASEQGAKRVVLLPVSVPSHSSLMKAAAEQLRQVLSTVEIKTPSVPVLHNIDAQSRDSAEAIREALVQQLYKPVRWVACVQALKARGAKMLIEMGPGKVLTGLTRRIDKSLSAQPLFDASGLAKILNLS
ncbi:MAG TPA: [acyl-carrier-protein] S-malonyltransferase [Halothiobacillus sp.]|nr:[acyl-carrier-protein] S-malonyltransferase [Halothiobacillus sp.]